MALTYYKRFRMEIDLSRRSSAAGLLPPDYFLVPWDAGLIDAHAEVKYHSFREEIDAGVFPCLGDWYGCRQLMREIVAKAGFLAEATWLAACRQASEVAHCGTIQCVVERGPIVAVQNLGVVPEHRGRGLGRVLLLTALDQVRLRGIHRVYLEVTAGNHTAISLYRSIGFRKARTVYKAVEPVPVA